MTYISIDMMETISKKLQQPFPQEDIEWRVQQSGIHNGDAWAMIMPYVTSRAIQQRLDDVVGAGNWKNEFSTVTTERGLSFMCGISILVDTQWVTKYDGADETDFEHFKGGISNAMKRAGVQWGIGRYLYGLDVQFAKLQKGKTLHFKTKIKKDKNDRGEWYSYDFPPVPSWALPNAPKTETTKADETIKKELGGRNFNEEASNCKTMEELAQWWTNLTPQSKTQAEEIKNNRKEEIKKGLQKPQETAKEEPAPKSNPYDFLVLKDKKFVELKAIAKDVKVVGYGKMNKTKLIESIIKQTKGD